MLFSQLPVDARLEILNHLKIQDLASVRLVSKQLKDESDYLIQRKPIAELNENLSDLITHLNEKIGSLKKELEMANANKEEFIKNSLPTSAGILTLGRIALVAIPLIDACLFYRMIKRDSNAVDFLSDIAINFGVGLLEFPLILLTREAKNAVSKYDAARKESFDKVTKCEKTLHQAKINSSKQLSMARQRPQHKFFKSKHTETEDNLKSFDIDLEKQAEKSPTSFGG